MPRAADIHGLYCPVCNVSLVMSARQNIEIDYCPQCRGVWLDRGELDKIIERSVADLGPAQAQAAPAQAEPAQAAPAQAAPAPQPAPQRPPQDRHRGRHDDDDDDRDYDNRRGKPYKYKRRKSWLEELFD